MFRKTEKWLCLILVCVMIVPLVSGAVFAVDGNELAVSHTESPIEPTNHSFTDVHDGRWYSEAVQFAYEHNIMQGTSPTTFLPNNTLTRAQMAQVLYNMEGRPLVSFWSSFSDVERGKWYTDAVMWTYIRDIVQGVGDRRFAPMAPITREQIATILYRFAEFRRYDVTISPSATSAFLDAEQISSWAVDGMQWAVHHGLIQGTPTGLLNPRGTATRAQVATILMRFMQRFEMSEDFELIISVEEATLPQIEPFLVNIELKNNSLRDHEIAYFLLLHPYIPGAHLRYVEVPTRPIFEVIGSGSEISHTVLLNRFYNILPPGIHQLTFSAIFYLDWEQPDDLGNEPTPGERPWEPPNTARQIEVVSNTVELTVTESNLPTAEDFELAIFVEEPTVVHGENFVVEITLNNNRGEDLEISFIGHPVSPNIDGQIWHTGSFPSKYPYFMTLESGYFLETWRLGGRLVENWESPNWENKRWVLRPGTYELRFSTAFTVHFENDYSRSIRVWSNPVVLTVLERE